MTKRKIKRLLIVVPLAVGVANLIGWLIGLNAIIVTLLVGVLAFGFSAAADALTR